MQGRLTKRLLTGVAAAAVIAGVTAAVVMAAQPASHHRRHPDRSSTLTTAASYLGMTATQLRSELQAGKSLAEVANATASKSSAGLIQALEAAQQQRLSAAAAKVPARITAEVNRKRSEDQASEAAAAYLGVSVATLRADVRSGKDLGEIANATAGKSEAGLIETVVAARKAALSSRVKSGAITQAQADAARSRLLSRVTARVHGARPGRGRTP